MSKRRLKGEIVSLKMAKTAVVKVRSIKQHPKYHKRYRSDKRYKAHLLKSGYKMGDKVIIEESQPISKEKHWIVLKKV